MGERRKEGALERWRRRVGGIFEGTRRLGGFVCGWIEVARRGASNAHTGQPRRGAEGVTRGENEPSGGRQIFTPAGVKGSPGGVKLTPGGMEKLQLWEVSGKFRTSFSENGRIFLLWKNYFQVGFLVCLVLYKLLVL